jgi:hypothetical protein
MKTPRNRGTLLVAHLDFMFGFLHNLHRTWPRTCAEKATAGIVRALENDRRRRAYQNALTIGQRNEFVAIIEGQVELPVPPVALAPLLLGGLDLLLAGRHEIPPDVARAAERRATEDNKAGTGRPGGDAYRILWSEDHPGPGRPKGLLNKFTGDLKEAYLQAAQAAGGTDGIAGYLYDQAIKENPSPFMTGLAKLLPLMLEGNKDAPIIVERVRYTDGGTDGDAK